MKLIYRGECSGDRMNFPIVGEWRSGDEKNPCEKISNMLLKKYPTLIKKVREKIERKQIIEESIEIEQSQEINYIEFSKDELITECVNKGIDPPDRSNKSELRTILENYDREVK